MVDGIDKIDILIHQLSQLEEDLDKLDSDRQTGLRLRLRRKARDCQSPDSSP